MSDHSNKPSREIAIAPGQVLKFRYRNWQGIVADRTARFEALIYGSTEWHRAPQWLVKAVDLDKGEVRLFALQDMVPLEVD
jgi:predicted DNA-binding transcriptional regulator YafY